MECLRKTHLDVIKRLKRANGQINKVILMLEEGQDECITIAQQMQAAYSAIGKAKTVLVQDHIEGCINIDEITKPSKAQNKMKELKEITKYLSS
jgi:DNA-binding FrmR family transcriptional regulator